MLLLMIFFELFNLIPKELDFFEKPLICIIIYIEKEELFMYIGVLVELSNKNIDKKFIYSVPKDLEKNIKLGIRVEVPFGYQRLEGFVISFEEKPEMETKSIISIIDEDIILNEELLKLGKIMQEETLSTLISCYQVMLPKALKASRKSSVSKKYDIFYELVKIPEKTTKKQDEIIELFKMRKIIPKKNYKRYLLAA